MLLVASLLFAPVTRAADVTWFAPSVVHNSNASMTVGGTYTSNFGVAFTTGSSGPYTMGWVEIDLSTSSVTAGAGSITLALRDTTNTTAYSAVAGTTEYAVDTVAFTMPTTTSTMFKLRLTSANLPNITAYAMSAGAAYSLIAYGPTVSIGMGRTTGYLSGTTNNNYTVSNGFTALDTFRNNSANYTNNTNSFPTLSFSFGTTVTNTAPVASIVAISGTVAVGQTLTSSYSYNDTDTDAESASTYQWYRQDDSSGTNRAAISGATGATTAGTGGLPTTGTIPGYTVAVADAGKYIVVGVVPKAAAGTTPGSEAFSSASSQVPNVPGAPTSPTATAGNAQISVGFTAPGSNGGATITGYTATCTSSDGGAAGANTGSTSPIVVSSLTNDKTYTCTVKATNSTGDSVASSPSSSAIPVAPLAGVCGSASSSTLLTAAPSGGVLCSVGSLFGSVATNAGTYTWVCQGTNGGGNSPQCSAPRGFTVTASAGANGSISPSGAQVVAYNAMPSFTLTPASNNYATGSVGGTCGGTRTGNSFATAAVTADCSVSAIFAPVASAPAIPTTSSGVTATLSAVGCSSVDSNATRFVAAPSGAPVNTAFPYGLLDFKLTGCSGGSVTVTVTYSQPIPSGATFWKAVNGVYSAYNPQSNPTIIGASSVTFTLVDGGSGDDDGAVNGEIHDPSGLGFAASAESIPTLSEWGLIALTGLMGLFGLRQMRRRDPSNRLV